ncbi:MAG: esterase-like activity of phytase family protein [Hyphomonadaceae bacterium]|nr:esterase-like activity of phytase family protein [Hyphomonadaceae bacterium]
MIRFALCAALLAFASACSPVRADAPIDEQWRSVAVSARPAELGEERIGVLQFRGGLELSSDDAGFGGWSGLEVLEDGRLIAVSDAGAWLSARLMFDDEGKLIGLSETRMALMRDENGLPFERKEDGDAEDLAQLPDGRFAVSFEQSQSIRIYDLNRDGPFGAASAGPALEAAQSLPSNAGLEALTALADGALLVGAEDRGELWRAPLFGNEPAPALAARYPLQLGYALVSLDRLPDNDDVVALERFYAPVIGVRTRITRIAVDSLQSDELRVTEWARFAPPLLLDNFEAIATARAPGGGLRLYILSDDNFSDQQRTLLYAFDAALD